MMAIATIIKKLKVIIRRLWNFLIVLQVKSNIFKYSTPWVNMVKHKKGREALIYERLYLFTQRQVFFLFKLIILRKQREFF